jgi:inward rectifier potassium channel
MTRLDRDPVQFKVGTAELIKLGTKRYDLSDPYHLAITMRWRGFFAACLAIDLALNLVFAVLYDLVPHCVANVRPGSLSDAFFFSIETLATVGYGVMAPSSTYGHVVASLELTCGLAFTALFTGLTFVRFSRIKAKIIFAKTAVVAQHGGLPTLMVRMGYDRAGSLADAEARMTFMRLIQTAEGQTYRQSDELKLIRNRMALMVLSWTLMHEIDAESPLHGFTPERLAASDARLIVTMRARNHAAGAEVFDIAMYHPEEVLFGMSYQDMVHRDDAGRIHADLRKLDLVERDPLGATEAETTVRS